MTYGDFWDGDPEMAPAIREAYKIKMKLYDQLAWNQGLYFYDALCDVAPIFRAFSKAKKPSPYPTEPYSYKESETATKSTTAKTAEERKMESAKVGFEVFAVAFNKQFHDRKEVNADARQRTDAGN